MRASEFSNPSYDMSQVKITADYSDPEFVEIDAFYQDRMIGRVEFEIQPDKVLESYWTFVEPEFRGCGLGRKMYDYARGLGYKIRQSNALTAKGRQFWEKNPEMALEEINPDMRNPGFKHQQEIGDFILTAETIKGPHMTKLNITCHDRYDMEDIIGTVDFWVGTKALTSGLTWVAYERRKQGVASAMYAYAKMLGNDVKPSRCQLPAGKGMWDAWKKSGEAQHLLPESESYQPPELHTGDKILKGKFKNSPAEIKGFKKDKHNQPVLKTNKGDIQLFKPRVTKLMKEEINPDILDPHFSDEQEIGDYRFTANMELAGYSKTPQLVIRCYDGETRIGEVKFYSTYGDSLISSLTTVSPIYQKQGIASLMYAYARMLGNTIEPSKSQLPPGKKMWKSWKKAGDAEHLMKESAPFRVSLDKLVPTRDAYDWNQMDPDVVGSFARIVGTPKWDDNEGTLVVEPRPDGRYDIIDGHHRYAGLKKAGAKDALVTLEEAELDPTGWGGTPQGTDVDYFGMRVQMRPSMFLKLAAPLTSAGENPSVAQHMEKGGKIAYPFLDIQEPPEWEDGNFKQDAKVKTHEGRNRMKKWIQLHGDEPIQVNIFFRGANRRRFITPEMIKKLSQGLFSETGSYIVGPIFDPRNVQ